MKEKKVKKPYSKKRKALLISLPFLIGGVGFVGVNYFEGEEVKYDGKNMYGNPNPESDAKFIDNSDEFQYFGSVLAEEESEDSVEKEITLHELFPILLTEPLSKEKKAQAHKETMRTDGMGEYVESLQSSIEAYMNGTFSWNHQSKDNLNDFLAFRGGDYLLNLEEVDAKEMYEDIYQKIQEGMLSIEYKFLQDDSGIFVHPDRGGYVVSGEVQIRYQSENETQIKGIEPNKWFSFPYEVEFNFKTTNETDDWEFWEDEEIGLLLKGAEYTYKQTTK